MPLGLMRKCGFAYQGKDKPELGDEQILAKIGTLQPIFPRKFSMHRLEELSTIDPVLYYAQYKNSPIGVGIKDFNIEKIKLFEFDSRGNVVYRDDNGWLQRWPKESLDVVMTVDPNSGSLTSPDFPAIVVSAQSPFAQVFILETWSRRVQPDAFCEMIFEMWERWQPRVLGIEKAGQQTTEFWFKKLAKQRQTFINVQPLLPRGRKKEDRIRKGIQPIVNKGLLFMRKGQTILAHQLKFHPDLTNDDELDALAYGPDVWQSPLTASEIEEEEDAVNTIMSRRNALTGY